MSTEELSNDCKLCLPDRTEKGEPPRQLELLGKTEKRELDVLICPWCDFNRE
jgi:hypothetical protein